MRALLLILFLLGGASSQSASLVAARQRTITLIQQHERLFPGHRCAGGQPDWHTDIVVFPTGRADRVYTFSFGVASAYQLSGSGTRLVWCARAIEAPATWRPLTPVARALAFPLRTTSGALPTESGGLDVISSLGGEVTFARQNVAGTRVCERATPAGENHRSAFQLDARDHCP